MELEMELVGLKLPRGLKKDIRVHCVKKDIKFQDFVAKALKEALKKAVK